MAEAPVDSDCEDDLNSTAGKLSSNASFADSDDDSMAGFEEDFDNDGGDGEFEALNETVKSNEKVFVKKKRKRNDPTKRKKIRRILREEDLTEVTISAQKEEKERLRRLELQRSLAAAAAVSTSAQNSNSAENITHARNSRPTTPVSVDVREKKDPDAQVIIIDSDDERENSSTVNCCHSQMNLNGSSIEIISSDSEVEITGESDDDEEDDDDCSNLSHGAVDYENSGLHVDDSINQLDSHGRVLVNVNHPVDEEDIFLAPQIAKVIKPHQIGGVRFFYDNLIETLRRFKQTAGFGCILAHSMGLGKTLQVVSFVDIFLRHTSANKVLCIVPINTIQNWLAEFNMWLPPKPGPMADSNGMMVEPGDSSKIRYREFEVFLLNEAQKTTLSRSKVIGEWNKYGGVLLLGYELFRLLATVTPSMSSSKSMPSNRKKKSPASSDKTNGEPEVIDLDEEEKHMELLIGVQKALCNPGADLVICDEGHRIKNDQSNISQALKRVHTRRRVVLTGYPLQNNLQEYWCMVDFVRPNFLGNKQEFCNMFERPILNGQCTDSTPSDVKLMRFRAHVLHSLLEGFVQRRSQSVLTKCLPSKEEHIILVNLSSIQKELYNTYVSYLLDSVGYINPIKGFHTCTKIWNHPDIFYRSLDISDVRTESPLTIPDEDNGRVQNSKSADRVAMLSSSSAEVLNQNENHSATRMNSEDDSSTPQNIQPVMSAPLSAQAVLRNTVQMRQMNTWQHSGQTVIVSTTQALQKTTECSASVNQPAGFTNFGEDDMMWAKTVFKDYRTGVMENGGKLVVLMHIIEESLNLGEKVLVFSQSLSTLNVIEEFLAKCEIPSFPGRPTDPRKPTRWMKNKSYFRLDGHTSSQERERLVNRFNAKENTDVLLFMLSTRAGCLGINLVGASRVVVFDASWNPCHDVQAICRVYRYGQVKPVHIYRLISIGTMEKKIYDRQISKQGMANRIVDELNPEANFSKQEIMKLICEKESSSPQADLVAAAGQFNDPVLARLCLNCSHWISKVPFKHESLLADKKEKKLTKAEKREAKRGYEMEKRIIMQQYGARAYCPGVIQPVNNRIAQQPYAPKSIQPVGLDRVSQQPCTSNGDGSIRQTSASTSSQTMNLQSPLASLIRDGYPVTQGVHSMSVAQPNSNCDSSIAPPTANSNGSKNEVVTIDLDELPSPTKPLQQSAQTDQNQCNSTDFAKMSRPTFRNVPPAFIGFLLNQGDALEASRSLASGFQASSVPLTTNTENKEKEGEIGTDNTINTKENSENTNENGQTLRGLLENNLTPQGVREDSMSRTHPAVQNEEIVVGKGNTSPSPPIAQDQTIMENQVSQGEGNVLSSDTPPMEQNGKNPGSSLK